MNRAKMALALMIAMLAGQEASAQQYTPPGTSPFPSPPVSPLVNLGLGRSPGISYFGIVQPQQEFYNFEASQLNQQRNTGTIGSGLARTGVNSQFMNYAGYFNNVGGQRLGIPVPPPGYSAPLPLGGRGRRN